MTAPLKVGVIGVGGIAQMMHLPSLSERPDLFQITAIADTSQATLDAVGTRYGVAARHTDYRELVRRPDVDAVLLLASGSHRDPAVAALENKKHLFIEKPLGFSLGESEAIASVAKKTPVTTMVGYHKRYDPAYRRARELVRGMKDLRYVEVTVLHPDDGAYRGHHAILPIQTAPKLVKTETEDIRGSHENVMKGPMAATFEEVAGKGTSSDKRVAGMILFQSLIHDINAVRGILGEPESVVSAEVWREGFAQHSITRFPKDVRLSMSWVSVPGLRNYEETISFVGNETRVKLVFPSPYLRHFNTPLYVERMEGEDHIVEQRTVSFEEAFRVELHHFADSIRTGKAPETTVDDALGDARWIHQIAAKY